MLSDESLKQRSNWKIESWGLRKLAPYWSGGVNLGAQLVFADRGHAIACPRTRVRLGVAAVGLGVK